MKIVKILVVESSKQPYVAEINDNIGELYGFVYFPFEELEIEKDIILVHTFQPDSFQKANRIIKDKIIYGSFVIVGKKNNQFISLTDDQIKNYMNVFDLQNATKMQI